MTPTSSQAWLPGHLRRSEQRHFRVAARVAAQPLSSLYRGGVGMNSVARHRMPSPGELSLHWHALERSGPRPSPTANLLRAVGAIGLMIAFVGSSIVRMWLGAKAAAIFTGPIRRYSQLTLKLLGVKLEIEGLGKLDGPGPHLLMANHGSLLDVFIFGALCARPTMFVVKKELGRIPFIGRLLKMCGHVLLDRSHPVCAMRELNRTIKTLKTGGRALIFPEGTRQPDGVLGPFRSGAFVVAARAQVPLIPIAVLGAAACCPKNPLAFRPGTVRIVILDPIDTTDWSDETIDAHAATVRELLATQIGRYRAQFLSTPASREKTIGILIVASPPAGAAKTVARSAVRTLL